MGTVSSRYLRSYFNVCVEKGADPETLTKLLAAGPTPFENPARRFPNETLLDMLALAQKLTDDTTIGLAAGRQFRPATFEDIGLALVSSKTIRQVMAINEKYQALTQELGKTHLTVKDGKAIVTWRPYIEDAERMRPVTEAVFAGYVVFGRWLIWVHNKEMVSMSFRHARPPHSAECDELFGCSVSYGASMDVMEMDGAIADLPLPQANADLLEILIARLDRQLAEMSKPTTARSEVFQYVQSMLSGGAPSLAQVAAALGVSERTLSRRLQVEGESYRSIVEDVRKEACELYIRERNKSIAEIAQALGYSEQSAFTRAFKLWYGKPPSEFIKDA